MKKYKRFFFDFPVVVKHVSRDLQVFPSFPVKSYTNIYDVSKYMSKLTRIWRHYIYRQMFAMCEKVNVT